MGDWETGNYMGLIFAEKLILDTCYWILKPYWLRRPAGSKLMNLPSCFFSWCAESSVATADAQQSNAAGTVSKLTNLSILPQEGVFNKSQAQASLSLISSFPLRPVCQSMCPNSIDQRNKMGEKKYNK